MSHEILIDRIRAATADTPRRQLHDGVVHAIEDAIASHLLEPGSLLPSERDLVSALGISRNVIRRALATLESEGIVATRHGHGTFVPRELRKSTNSALGFSEEMTRRGLKVTSRILRFERRPPIGLEAIDLGMNPDAELVSLVRLRLADAVPIAIEYALVPGWAVGADYDGADSLYGAMERAASRPVRVLQEISAAPASAEAAAGLGIVAGAPVLRITRKGWDKANSISEYTESLFHCDRYTWITELRK